MTIQVNLVPNPKSNSNSPELSLFKILPLTYYHSYLAATLNLTSLFIIAFLGATHFFTAGLFWIRSNLVH